MNTAIIVAAGKGKRFGAEKPKQFIEILGKPLLIHTLEKFENCAAVNEIIVVLSEAEISDFRKTVEKFNFNKIRKIVSGGETRAESVFNGLNSINDEAAEIVAVHDGARPLVSVEEITHTISKTQDTGAACLVAKVTDTIKKVKDGKIVKTINRQHLRRAQTPQCFRIELLKRAFSENVIDETITDECFLVEKLGVEISVVEGSAQNIKITTPEDLIFAESLLKKQIKSTNV